MRSMTFLDAKPIIWLVGFMDAIGIFEAKTKFTSICEKVVRTGQAVVVSKRGRPMVMVTPIPSHLGSERPDILTAWREWKDSNGLLTGDFPEVWKSRSGTKPNPLRE